MLVNDLRLLKNSGAFIEYECFNWIFMNAIFLVQILLHMNKFICIQIDK